MAISTRMTADVSGLKKGISEAQQSVKTLDAELKRNEAQLKATGDKEQYLADKQRILNAQMKAQKSAAEQAEAALEAMNRNGVSKTSAEYQKMQQTLANAQAAMMETSVKLRDLGAGEDAATKGAASLSGGLNNIGKKMSLDQAIRGIDSVTSALERGAQTALRLGKAIGDAVTDSASWADDTATAASVLGMDVEKYQRYEGVFKTAADITVSDWERAKKRVQNVINKPTNEQIDILKALGIGTTKLVDTGGGILEPVVKDYEEMFWQLGERLREKVASGEMTQDLADTYANAIFGKSFDNLNPIFAMGQEAFQQALQDQNVVSEEAINKLAALNDQLIKTQEDFKKLQEEVTSGLAPALQKAAEVVDSLLGRLMDYLKTEDGQKALEGLETAVEGLFEDLGKIDPEEVVAGFVSVFNNIVGSFQWLVSNKGTVENVLKGIVTAWGFAKLTGGALQVLQLINGIRGLTGGGAGAAGAAGAASGASWGAAFASAALKAAPWLAGIYILTEGIFEGTHDNLGNNTLYNPDGSLTAEGKTVLNQDGTPNREGWEIGDMRQRQRAALEALWDEYRAGLSGTGNSEAFGAATKTVQELFGGEAGLFQSMMQQMHEWGSNGSWKDMADLPEDFFQFDVQPKVDENAAAQIAEEIGTVTVPVVMVPTSGGNTGRIRTPRGWEMPAVPKANGMPFVPWDGYPAILHRGERVMTAQQNKSFTYNNHNYFGSVNLHNGLEVDNLIDSINRRNRASQRGFGG